MVAPLSLHVLISSCLLMTITLATGVDDVQLHWSYSNPMSLLLPLIEEEFKLGCLAHSTVFTSFHQLHFAWYINGVLREEGSGTSFDMSFIPNGVLSNLKIRSFSMSDVGLYQCVVWMDDDVHVNKSISIHVDHQNYTFQINGDTKIIQGNPLTLECSFMSAERTVINYHWATGTSQENIIGTNDSLVIPSVAADTTYTCQVTLAPTSSKFTTNTTVTVISPPLVTNDSRVIINDPQRGTDVTLTCTIIGRDMSFVWFKGSTPLTTDDHHYINHDTLTILNSQYSNAGNYSCFASNIAGNSSQVHIVLISGEPMVKGSMVGQASLVEGDSIDLPCHVKGYPPPLVSWYHTPVDSTHPSLIATGNGHSLSPTNTLTISHLTVDDSGTYTCTANNSYGNQSIHYTISVSGVPLPPTLLDYTIVDPETVVLSWQQDATPLRVTEGYLIMYNSSSEEFVKHANVSSNNTVTLTNLIPANEYVVRIFAINSIGRSHLSSNIINISLPTSAPKLSYLNATGLSGGRSLLIKWSLLYTGGHSITSFNISLVSGATIITTIHIPVHRDQSTGSHLVEGLEPGTSYTLTADIDNSLMSRTQSVAVTTIPGPPSSPSKPLVHNISTDWVRLSFAFDSIGSETVTHYLVNVTNKEGSTLRQLMVPSDRQPSARVPVHVIVDGLEGGQLYGFRVAGHTHIGASSFSELSDIIRTTNDYVLYVIIGSIIGTSLLVVAILSVVCCMVCLCRRNSQTKHTINSRMTFPNTNISPVPSLSKRDDLDIADDSPPNSSVTGVHGYPPFSPILMSTSAPSHQRTHSFSSTASSGHPIISQTSSNGNRSDSSHIPPRISPCLYDDSAYGGSSDRVGGVTDIGKPFFYSAPSIHRVRDNIGPGGNNSNSFRIFNHVTDV